MTTYKLRALNAFVDAENGKLLTVGDIVETSSFGRVCNIVGQGLGELISARHDGRSGKRILIHQNLLYKIGGIETANRQLAKAFIDHDITFIFGRADQTQLVELAKNCSVILDDGVQNYETDIFIMANYDSADFIIKRVKAEKIYQQIHADFKGLMAMPEWKNFAWKPHERVDKVLAVSTTAQKGLREALGIESVVVPNVLAPLDTEHKRLVFLVLSRASREKGIERLLDMVDRFNAAGKDFVVFLCSDIAQLYKQDKDRIEASDKILVMPPSPYSQELLRSADYLVQLSKNESYCYSVREALQMSVPVICSKIPEFEKLIKNGKNGYILENDLSNLNIDKIFNKVPQPKPYSEEISPMWEKVLKGEL